MVTGSLSSTVAHATGTHSVVQLAGEIDTVTAPDLRLCVIEQLAPRPRELVLDMSGVTFCGSAGLALLIEVDSIAKRQGTTLYLARVPKVVSRVLDIAGVAGLFSGDPPLRAAGL